MNLSTVLLVIHQLWYHNRWRNYDCDVMVKIKRNSSGVSNRPKISRFTQFSCFIIFVILIFALYWAVHLFHTNIKEAWVHVCYIHACQQKSTFSLMIINHEFQKKKRPRSYHSLQNFLKFLAAVKEELRLLKKKPTNPTPKRTDLLTDRRMLNDRSKTSYILRKFITCMPGLCFEIAIRHQRLEDSL